MNHDGVQLCCAFLYSILAHSAHIHSESCYLSYSVTAQMFTVVLV